jgi:hypothetical protein
MKNDFIRKELRGAPQKAVLIRNIDCIQYSLYILAQGK